MVGVVIEDLPGDAPAVSRRSQDLSPVPSVTGHPRGVEHLHGMLSARLPLRSNPLQGCRVRPLGLYRQALVSQATWLRPMLLWSAGSDVFGGVSW